MRILWRHLPSITLLQGKWTDDSRKNNYSTFRRLFHKRYFRRKQVSSFINAFIVQSVLSQKNDDPQVFIKKVKNFNYFSRLAGGAAFLNSYVQSNPTGHLVSVGGGPRGVMQFNAEVDFLKEHQADFEKLMELGAFYNIKTTIIEKQGWEAISGGVAWTETFGAAMMNTGAEMEIQARLINYIEREKTSIEQELEGNPVALAIFKRALRSTGVFEAPFNRALVTRRIMGRELKQHFLNQVRLAKSLPLGYDVDVFCDTTVKGIDISNPTKPIVLAAEKGGEVIGFQADIVRINIGTVTHCPTRDKEVQKLTYWGPMFGSLKPDVAADISGNNKGVTAFLKEKGLTDQSGKLNSEATLLVGGSGLSLYDQILALQESMELFVKVPESELDKYPLGFKVNEAAIKKFVTDRENKIIPVIVIISLTPGKWIYPRHSHGPWWTQIFGKEENPSTPLAGSAKVQHALFLHGEGGHVFDHWKTITNGAVAAYLNMHPDDLAKKKDTYTLLKEQYQRSFERAKKINNYCTDGTVTRTLEGASREAALGTIIGVGMETGPGPIYQDEDSLAKFAPLTARGRIGYLIHRAQMLSISNLETYKPTQENAAKQKLMLKNFGEMMSHVTSSPIEVHSLVQMLIDAGIVAYIPLDYANIKNVGNKLRIDPAAIAKIDEKPYLQRVGGAQSLADQEFDAFIVSATFYGKPDVVPIASGELSDDNAITQGDSDNTLPSNELLALCEDDSEVSSDKEGTLVKSLNTLFGLQSKTLSKKLRKIEGHMNEFFKIYIPGSGYAVTPNRRLQVQAGGKSVRTTVELNGLSGKGVGVNDAAKYVGDPSVDEAFKSLKMKSGIFATDVNNRESITNLVKSQAYYRMALEHLRAAGVPDAQEELERFYFLQNLNSRSLVDSILPGGRIVVENPYAEYDKEVRKFEPYYNIARLAAAFIKAISELTNGDASSYGNLYSVGRDFFEDMTLNFENFEEKLRKVEWQGADVENIISKMKASLGSNYKYAPRDGASYFAAFVDYPEHVHQLAYQWALKTAEAQLKAKKPSDGFDISKIFTPDDIWIEPC